MRLTIARAIGLTFLLSLVLGVSIAEAIPKFTSTETIQFPSGNLVVTFDEGGQKRFESVDYRLAATAEARSCTTVNDVTQCISVRWEPSADVTGLIPDDKGRVAGSLALDSGAGGGTICGCVTHMDYSEATLTNLTSGRVYRLEPISGDSP
jgi:hypothetical protein